MVQRFCRWFLFKVLGFSEQVTVEFPAKYIIALAPHTSNWDFLIGQLYSRACGFHCDFMMKKEWFWGPLGYLFRKLGGIPVHRSKSYSLTDQLAEVARSRESFHLCITPEGTRKRQQEWKKGFYYIALKAEIPILLFGLDYKEKKIVCTKSIIPTGNIEKELTEIKRYFQPFSGKHPEMFTTGV